MAAEDSADANLNKKSRRKAGFFVTQMRGTLLSRLSELSKLGELSITLNLLNMLNSLKELS